MNGLKAVITRNRDRNYEIRLELHRGNEITDLNHQGVGVTWTLKGARKVARRMLAKATSGKGAFREEVTL
jgi:hypothetical protein